MPTLRALPAPRIRQALRSLGKQPVFTAVAVLSLALALALNTAMFALVDAVLHPVQPYRDVDRLVEVRLIGGARQRPVPLEAKYEAVRAAMGPSAEIAAYYYLPAAVETRSRAMSGMAAAIAPNTFDLLGVRPAVGRALGASGAAVPEALISYRLWQRAFGGAPLEQQATVQVGGTVYTVIGVMPQGVHFPGDADAWIPLASAAADPTLRRIGPIPLLRLAPGTTRAAIDAAATAAAGRLTSALSPEHPITARILTMGQPSPPASLRDGSPFFTIVAIVLVIACANLGTLMLARGMARRHETALRIALGATRRDVVVHVLTECSLIVIAGVVLGTVLTVYALFVLPHYATAVVPLLGDITPMPSGRVFGAVGAVAVAIVALAGIAPALRAAATDPASPLKEGGASTTGRIRDRYNPLIMVEVALSTALLMCCALFVQQVARLAVYELRYAAKRTVVASVSVPRPMRASASSIARFYRDALDGARRLPHARFAATRHSLYVDGPMVFGEAGKAGAQWMNLRAYAVVSPDFLRALGMSVVRGRDFASGDEAGAAPVVIVDEEAAHRLWPNSDPVGRMIKLGSMASRQPWLQVIGVAHAPELQYRRSDYVPPDPQIFVVVPGDTAAERVVLVQGDGVGGDAGRAALALAVAGALRAAGLERDAARVRPWLESYEASVAMNGFFASLLGAFGAFGLALCAVGLYGVLSYSVSRRLREYAVRIALGAARRDVARLVLHDAAVTALAGVGVGAFFALWVTRPFAMDNGGPYTDAIALVAAEIVLFTVAAVASMIPLRRAVRADPVAILRAS